MSKTLGPTPLLEVLAPSIKTDATIQAAANAVDSALLPIIRAIPRQLFQARLWQDESRLSPSLRRIVQFCGGLPPFSDEELELLAWQMHVDFWDPAWPRAVRENLVKHATAWHRLKGTAAGVKLALALFGIEAVVEEDGAGEDWATWQLGLLSANVDPRMAPAESGVEPALAVARLAWAVATEMQPQRCRLFRIYNAEHDFRPIVLTDGPPLGEGCLSFYSGRQEPGQGPVISPVISLGASHRAQSEVYAPNGKAGLALHSTLSVLSPYVDMFILGYSRLGDDYPNNHGFVVAELLGLSCPAPQPEYFHIPHSHTTRSEISLGDYEADPRYGNNLGGINYCLGVPLATVWQNPFILGESLLSSHDYGLQEIELREFFTTLLSVPVQALLQKTNAPWPPANPVVVAIHATHAGSSAPLRNQLWQGRWDKRKWNNYLAWTNLTET